MLPIINFCTISWESQIDKIHSLLKQAIQNILEGEFREHHGTIIKRNAVYVEYNMCFQLVSNNLLYNFQTFTPTCLTGHYHYNLIDLSRFSPKIKYQFPNSI